MIPEISKKEFDYILPDEKIARFPLAQRDASKLLWYADSVIKDYNFSDLPNLLDPDSTLVFNDTKVIAARLLFEKPISGHIEIFLLENSDHLPIEIALQAHKSCIWNCLIGGGRLWQAGQSIQTSRVYQSQTLVLSAERQSSQEPSVRFEWDNENLNFAQIIEIFGLVPLPPYLKRAPEAQDQLRYQTIYACHQGAVAAPTAGLHFTDKTLEDIAALNIHIAKVTLHVGAGTFKPIQQELLKDHDMHCEQIRISAQLIEQLLSASKIIAVGTTSMRTLESLFWFGATLLDNPETDFFVQKLISYQPQYAQMPDKKAVLEAVQKYMADNNHQELIGQTEILIMPGYRFGLCNGLITNFHQPSSTLIALISAFVGPDWQKIYAHALAENYRFLSYGDSSLLFGKPNPNQ